MLIALLPLPLTTLAAQGAKAWQSLSQKKVQQLYGRRLGWLIIFLEQAAVIPSWAAQRALAAPFSYRPRLLTIRYSQPVGKTAVICAASAATEERLSEQVVVVLGTQWGDEGKGKLVDILARQYDVVARAQVGLPDSPVLKRGLSTSFNLVPESLPFD